MARDLESARAISDQLFATAGDPEELAEKLRARRAERNDSGIERWRDWLGANLHDTLALGDDELERRHDLIQWLFPLGSRSPVNADAPVIGRHAMLMAVQAEPVLRDALLMAWQRMLRFYGLFEVQGSVRWVDAPRDWAASVTHHDRRISRMLHAMHSAGLDAQAMALMDFLQQQFVAKPHRAKALSWWRHQVVS